MKIAVVGATGEVGRSMVKILEERGLSPQVLRFFASERSAGQRMAFAGREIEVEKLEESWVPEGTFDYVLLSAGSGLSKWFSPIAARAGAVVIDNSSAWRMDPQVPLVVPEVNGHLLEGYRGIVANPNCSTIQMVLALQGVHRRWGIRIIVVSTYQAVSGAGHRGIKELAAQEQGKQGHQVFSAPIHHNLVPQIGAFLDSGFSEEEMKMVDEPRKILEDPQLSIWPTTVRVPVVYGHSESIFVETREPFGSLEELKEVMTDQESVVLSEDPIITPRALAGTDQSFVSRLRSFDGRRFLCWNVADNIRVGAATNAVRILQRHSALNGLA